MILDAARAWREEYGSDHEWAARLAERVLAGISGQLSAPGEAPAACRAYQRADSCLPGTSHTCQRHHKYDCETSGNLQLFLEMGAESRQRRCAH